MNKTKKAGNNFDMKKLLVFIFALIPLFGISFFKKESQNLFDFQGIERACFVTKQVPEIGDVTETLSYNYVYAQGDEIKKLSETLESDGVMLYFVNQDCEKLQKKLNMLVFSKEKIGDADVIYGYTDKYSNWILLKGKKVNVQMVVKNKEIIVGFPMILGGF